MSLTTNQNILYQVAFKEACEFARKKEETTSGEQLLKMSLSLYHNVLVKGLQSIEDSQEVEVKKNLTM